jgi:hypothetical protein
VAIGHFFSSLKMLSAVVPHGWNADDDRRLSRFYAKKYPLAYIPSLIEWQAYMERNYPSFYCGPEMRPDPALQLERYNQWRACIQADFLQNGGAFDMEDRFRTSGAEDWAMEGFYRIASEEEVVCFYCRTTLPFNPLSNYEVIQRAHRKRSPDCHFRRDKEAIYRILSSSGI